jgi:hypothetical protein
MPIVTEFDAARKRLRTTATGVISLADLFAHLDSEEADKHLAAPELIDARGATTKLTTPELRQLISRMRDYASHAALGPTALVTDNDVVFGMARMYSVLIEEFDARFFVFRSLADAERWLDAGAPALDAP